MMDKLEKLKKIISGYGSVAIAFSSGVDSAFLLKVAHDVLGDQAIAITATSHFFPQRESSEAKDFCDQYGIRQVVVEIDETQIDGFRENPANRCYICKKKLFTDMMQIAGEQGILVLAEGSNMDDLGDYRPGLIAIKELGIKSPLREAGLTKQEIRELSKQMYLPTWDKPSYACLASRFVYGETIDREKLSMVERAEQLLMEMGFTQMRVRIHGRMARIELRPEDIPAFMDEKIRTIVHNKLKEYGFTYVALDLLGYRTGSMNENLKNDTLLKKEG